MSDVSTTAIRTEPLGKRYGATVALDALDLAVEVYGYLGPNGAGKTTTIRLLLGLHRPTSGRVQREDAHGMLAQWRVSATKS